LFRAMHVGGGHGTPLGHQELDVACGPACPSFASYRSL
jgi:hypothetical protein